MLTWIDWNALKCWISDETFLANTFFQATDKIWTLIIWTTRFTQIFGSTIWPNFVYIAAFVWTSCLMDTNSAFIPHESFVTETSRSVWLTQASEIRILTCSIAISTAIKGKMLIFFTVSWKSKTIKFNFKLTNFLRIGHSSTLMQIPSTFLTNPISQAQPVLHSRVQALISLEDIGQDGSQLETHSE